VAPDQPVDVLKTLELRRLLVLVCQIVVCVLKKPTTLVAIISNLSFIPNDCTRGNLTEIPNCGVPFSSTNRPRSSAVESAIGGLMHVSDKSIIHVEVQS
jgi:hypothetical protein